MSQKCPRCSNTLEIIDIDGIKIDRCGSCCGIFLDETELGQIKDRGCASIESLASGGKLPAGRISEGEKINCVRCSSAMQTVNFSYTSGIMIDHCPACNSVWLDNGELGKIIDFLKAGESSNAEDQARYNDLLNEVKNKTRRQMENNFRSISSGGKMGSIVNFVYKMINKITG